jgi:hypothetical protein
MGLQLAVGCAFGFVFAYGCKNIGSSISVLPVGKAFKSGFFRKSMLF